MLALIQFKKNTKKAYNLCFLNGGELDSLALRGFKLAPPAPLPLKYDFSFGEPLQCLCRKFPFRNFFLLRLTL